MYRSFLTLASGVVGLLAGLAFMKALPPATRAEPENSRLAANSFPPGTYVLGGLSTATVKDAFEVKEPFTLHPVQYILSGGPKPTDRIIVDDDLEIERGKLRLFTDDDHIWSKDDKPSQAGQYCGWPILLVLPPGSKLRIRAIDCQQVSAELGELYLHRYDGASKRLTKGKKERSNPRLPHVFFEEEFDVDEGFPPLPKDRPEPQLTARRLDALWSDLGSSEPVRAYFGRWALAVSPGQSVPYLQQRVRPVAPLTAEQQRRVNQLLADLDNDEFEVREKATVELEKLGESVVPAMRQTLQSKPSAEVVRRIEKLLKPHDVSAAEPGSSRELSAVAVLEYSGTPAAKEMLEALARGTSGARLTDEAKAALRRLDGKSASP
jgi:hypothetical protein